MSITNTLGCQWEYLLAHFNQDHESSYIAPDWYTTMNELGKDGWELVTILPNYQAVWKRLRLDCNQALMPTPAAKAWVEGNSVLADELQNDYQRRYFQGS